MANVKEIPGHVRGAYERLEEVREYTGASPRVFALTLLIVLCWFVFNFILRE